MLVYFKHIGRYWHLCSKSLTDIFRALISFIFDYLSEKGIELIQNIKNRALRCIFKLKC